MGDSDVVVDQPVVLEHLGVAQAARVKLALGDGVLGQGRCGGEGLVRCPVVI